MRTLLLTLTTCLLALPPHAKYSGGTGEPNDPYQIATAADLIALGETPEDYDKHFLLTADVDLDPNLPGRRVFDKAVIAPDTDPNDRYHWFQGTPFTGVFDGNGHTISNLTITGTDYLGLFGSLEWQAEVKNLGVVDVNILGSGSHVGGLAGIGGTVTSCYSTGDVSGADCVGGLVGAGSATYCYSTASVSGNWDVGGLIGYNTATVTQCYSIGAISGAACVGGLIGYNYYGTVTHCYSTGAVSGTWNVGGLVGCNSGYYGTVTRCHSSATVSGDENVGGLVGENFDASVTASCSTGAVSGNEYVGGLVGLHNAEAGAVVTRCYSTGRVSGNSYVGGLIGGTGAWAREPMGIQGGDVTECYSTGAVSGTSFVGGLVGFNYPWGSNRITTSFWDIQTSGQATGDGGTGKTTAEMQTAKTFLDAAWDFVGETANGTEDLWWILEGKDYPRLWWEAQN